MDAAWSQPFVVWPGRGSPVSLATWAREIRTFVAASLSPPPIPDDAARGQGEPVIVVPAYLSPASSTDALRKFLLRQGFAAECWGCGMNLGPTRHSIEMLDRRLRRSAEKHGRKVALVGLSLGGTLAREAAKRCPEYVARVVTLASPINMPVTTPLAPLARLTALLWDGRAGDAIDRIAEPPPVPLTAIISPVDGVVDWRACLPRPAPEVETVLVRNAHMTIASNPEVLRLIATRLAQPPADPHAELRR
jgi:pimeloyl-ACP methyl ester carboxylesterase